jgi:hypothetical protein
MYKTILPIVFSVLFTTTGFTTSPANALTAEEFLKLLGVLGRSADDIERTFSPKNQPNVSPQIDSNYQPNLPQTTEQESDFTSDWSLE